MANDFLDPPGETVDPEELGVTKAQELFRFLASERHPYATLVEVRRADAGDVVVYDVQPEIPQYPDNSIQRTERLATLFFEGDDRVPRTLALRRDFPLVPHLQLEEDELPRSLCLFEAPYHEIRRSWTAARYVRRVREWLSRTARGELHAHDQPLEPLLLDPPIPIVLPEELFEDQDEDESPLGIVPVESEGGDESLPAAFLAGISGEDEPGFLALTIDTEPQTHGVIHHIPTNMAELADLLHRAGCDLWAELEDRLDTYWGDRGRYRGARLVLIVRLPKRREAEGEIEDYEMRVFVCLEDTIEDLGEGRDLWKRAPGMVEVAGRPLHREEADITGEEVPLFPLNPVKEVTRAEARRLSGIDDDEDFAVAAIGVGALGSQIAANLNRMGWGRWTVIDHDNLMPHNLVRHALPFWRGRFPYVGLSKARGTADLLNRQYLRSAGADWVNTNVLEYDQPDRFQQVIQEADVVIDMSATESVGRKLGSQEDLDARCVSVFLNPRGTDLVVLCEDRDQVFPIDVLEAQYHRGHLRNEALSGHLAVPEGRIRYGQSCRDITTRLPEDMVALHAGQGARAVRLAVERREATVRVFSACANGSVNTHSIEPVDWREEEHGIWTLRWDDAVASWMGELRDERLPAETGGILLGIHDFNQRTLYILDALPAPPDSIEDAWPPGFIRGREGLQEAVEDARDRTGLTVNYAGEWHSHPPHAEGTPSDDDRRLLEWLTSYLRREGLPAVMAIAWDGGISWHLQDTSAH